MSVPSDPGASADDGAPTDATDATDANDRFRRLSADVDLLASALGEVIRELEPWPRDIYCGAIGWAAPDGRSEFSVAIRTLIRDKTGHAVLNVGGGVVWDSTAQSEYEEALWKARFLSRFQPEPA